MPSASAAESNPADNSFELRVTIVAFVGILCLLLVAIGILWLLMKKSERRMMVLKKNFFY